MQEFDLNLVYEKYKQYLVFMELISDFPMLDEDIVYEDSFVDEHIFFISFMDPWYGYIIIYLRTMKFSFHISRDER